jgi:hypothetical protein
MATKTDQPQQQLDAASIEGYLADWEAYHIAGQHGRMAPPALEGELPPPPAQAREGEGEVKSGGIAVEDALRARHGATRDAELSAGGYYYAQKEEEVQEGDKKPQPKKETERKPSEGERRPPEPERKPPSRS